MTFNQILKDEISFLRELEFLHDAETVNDIKFNSYQTKIWGDTFWRRRHSHDSRLDPEIPFIYQSKPKTILEIGAAYGRVLRKIAENNNEEKAEITGIDINNHFRPYYETYSQKHPILQNTNIIYNDFITTTKLQKNYFDVIVLPMNTFPLVSPDKLEELFVNVKKYLKPDGLFIFSTNKYPLNRSLKFDKFKHYKHSGELLVELGKNLIANEVFSFGLEETFYGFQWITYVRYNKLTRNFKLIKSELFRSIGTIFHPNKLNDILIDNGATIMQFDEESHSVVYILSFD